MHQTNDSKEVGSFKNIYIYSSWFWTFTDKETMKPLQQLNMLLQTNSLFTNSSSEIKQGLTT